MAPGTESQAKSMVDLVVIPQLTTGFVKWVIGSNSIKLSAELLQLELESLRVMVVGTVTLLMVKLVEAPL